MQLAWSHPYWCATTSALCTNIPCSWATTRVCTLQIVSMIVYQEFELIDIPMALACEPHLPPQTAEGIPSKYVLVAVLSSRNTQQVKSFCPPTPKRTSTPTLQHYNLSRRGPTLSAKEMGCLEWNMVLHARAVNSVNGKQEVRSRRLGHYWRDKTSFASTVAHDEQTSMTSPLLIVLWGRVQWQKYAKFKYQLYLLL